MIPDESLIARAGAQYGVPPAIIYALGMQMSGFNQPSDSSTDSPKIGVFGMSPTQIQALGIDPKQAGGNEDLQVRAVAQYLSQRFQQTHSWKEVLSEYGGGGSSDWQNPTSPVGGFVNSVLGIAGANAEYGMGELGDAAVSDSFWNSAAEFGQDLGGLVGLGGIVTQDTVSHFTQSVTQLQQKQSSRYGGGADPAQGLSNSSISGVNLQGLPFPKQFMDAAHESENFGDRSGPGGYAERGNDYTMPSGTAITAPVDGTVHFQNYGGNDTGLTAYITSPGFPGKIYIGHLRAGSVQDGAQVKAGQQIAESGGGANDPNHGNSTGSHVEFGYIDTQGKVHDPRPLLTSAGQNPSQGSSGSIDPKVYSAISDAASKNGVPLQLALAIASQETGGSFNPSAVGDNGNSVGLYQLNSQGEGAGMSTQQRSDPVTNANIALAKVGQVLRDNPGMDPGQAAAMAQRPADPQSYASSVNSILQSASLPQTPSLQLPSGSATTQQKPSSGQGSVWDRFSQGQKNAEPTASQVSGFAQQAQQHGLDPDTINSTMNWLSPLMRRITGKAPTLEDVSKYGSLTQQDALQAIRNLPSSYYPEMTAGHFLDTFNQASLYSLNYQKRFPTLSETQRFISGGLKNNDISSYYQTQTQQDKSAWDQFTQKGMANQADQQAGDQFAMNGDTPKRYTTERFQ